MPQISAQTAIAGLLTRLVVLQVSSKHTLHPPYLGQKDYIPKPKKCMYEQTFITPRKQ
jgi:hypothetical protein